MTSKDVNRVASDGALQVSRRNALASIFLTLLLGVGSEAATNSTSAVVIDSITAVLYNDVVYIWGHVSDGSNSTQGYVVTIGGDIVGNVIVLADGTFRFATPYAYSYGAIDVQANDGQGNYSPVRHLEVAE